MEIAFSFSPRHGHVVVASWTEDFLAGLGGVE